MKQWHQAGGPVKLKKPRIDEISFIESFRKNLPTEEPPVEEETSLFTEPANLPDVRERDTIIPVQYEGLHDWAKAVASKFMTLRNAAPADGVTPAEQELENEVFKLAMESADDLKRFFAGGLQDIFKSPLLYMQQNEEMKKWFSELMNEKRLQQNRDSINKLLDKNPLAQDSPAFPFNVEPDPTKPGTWVSRTKIANAQRKEGALVFTNYQTWLDNVYWDPSTASLYSPWDKNYTNIENVVRPSYLLEQLSNELQKSANKLYVVKADDAEIGPMIIKNLELHRVCHELYIPLLQKVEHKALILMSPIWRSIDDLIVDQSLYSSVASVADQYRISVEALRNRADSWRQQIEAITLGDITNTLLQKIQIEVFNRGAAATDEQKTQAIMKVIQDIKRTFDEIIGRDLKDAIRALDINYQLQTELRELRTRVVSLLRENNRLKDTKIAGSRQSAPPPGGAQESPQLLDGVIKMVVSSELRKNRAFRYAEMVAGATQLASMNMYMRVPVEDMLVDKIKIVAAREQVPAQPARLVPILQKELLALDAFMGLDKTDPTGCGMALYKTNLLSARESAWNHVQRMCPEVKLNKLFENPNLLAAFATLTARLIAKAEEVHKRVATSHIASNLVASSLFDADQNMRFCLRQAGYTVPANSLEI